MASDRELGSAASDGPAALKGGHSESLRRRNRHSRRRLQVAMSSSAGWANFLHGALPVGSASTPIPNRRRPALPLPELAMFDHGALPVGPPLDVRPEAPEEREPPGVHHTVRGTYRTRYAPHARGRYSCDPAGQAALCLWYVRQAGGCYSEPVRVRLCGARTTGRQAGALLCVKQAGPLGRQARSCRPVRQAAYRSGRQDRTAGPDGRQDP